MKIHIQLLLILTFIFFIPQYSNSQRLLRDLKNKAQEKLNEKLQQETEDQVNKEIDKQIGIDDAEKRDSVNAERSQRRMNSVLKNLGINGEPIPIADNYHFTQAIEMHLETYYADGKKNSDGDFITLLNKDMKSMAYQATSGEMAEKSKGIFIMDVENKATIILSDDGINKTGIVFGLDSLTGATKPGIENTEIEDTPEYYAAHPNIKKTGKTKSIAGYKCEQYILTDEDSEAEVWLTRDLKMKTYDFFSTVFKIEMAATGMGWGYLMESTTKEKTGEKSFMQVTKIDPNANKSFRMSDYQITNMGNIKMPAGQE